MSVRPDPELGAWIEAWQSDAEPAPGVREAIRARVKRQSLNQRLWAACEGLASLLVLAFILYAARRAVHPLEGPVAGIFLALLVGSVVWSLWERRGVWRPSADTAAAYLDLATTRCRRQLNAVRAGYVILGIELAVFIPWIGFRLSGASLPRYLAAYAYLAFVAGAALAALISTWRRTRREAATLREIRRSLES